MNNDEGSNEQILMKMKVNDDADFEADECQYLLADSDSEFRTTKPQKRCCGCCVCLCNWFITTLFGNMNCFKGQVHNARNIRFGSKPSETFPPNVIKNQKYNFFTFIPKVLFEQFQFFLNFFFLAMAMSQFIPELRIGYLYTYWGPLGFVIAVTMIREAIDDLRRRQRDQSVNSQVYVKLTQFGGEKVIASSEIKVGDFICVEKDQRVPADLIFLRTTECNGSSFIRTDQLDGETDWKLKVALPFTQKLEKDDDLFNLDVSVFVEKPQKDIYNFIGKVRKHDTDTEEPLDIENTLWTNTVLASGRVVGLVVYTGTETRAAMNNNTPRSKVGLLDLEVNNLTKVLFVAVICLALVMICLKGFGGPWYRYFFRFVLLFSYIIPLSLRVNLDVGKSFYSWCIQRDEKMIGTVVRSSTIPEDLGRVSYLFSDKTGTLTQNEMVFKMMDLGSESYGMESFDEVSEHLKTYFRGKPATPKRSQIRRTIVSRIGEAVKAIALCHNVTPVREEGSESVVYQASSPDEVALVKWTESVHLSLIERDRQSMKLRSPLGEELSYTILHMFPFKSETKRMGIIVKDNSTGEITLYLKGADTVMNTMVEYNDWLMEKCTVLAEKGLRTLVVAKKSLTQEQYDVFEQRLKAANLGMSTAEKASRVSAVIESLECDLQLLCLTGVEDKLQNNVKQTLEILKYAGIKIWMLTGDKLETATCIAKSSRLVSPTQPLHVVGNIKDRQDAHRELNIMQRKTDAAIIIKGDALDICLKFYDCEFMELAVQCPSVVVCRCSPTQKSLVVKLIQKHTGKRTAAVGDGGNDVAMIQVADVGIGIEGKEGRQASLAADFSLTQFEYMSRLFLVHGRNSYKRSAALSQFVIHRGLIITTIQAIFSAIFYFSSVALYQGFLMVGYATFYTNFPVFALVLDQDVSPEMALSYPELYKDLTKGRCLSYKTFFVWVFISIYQGGIIMYGAMLLFEDEMLHIVSISFTALILTELLMVGLTVRTWHPLMVVAHAVSLLFYALSLVFLRYFDWNFIRSTGFAWKVFVLTLVSCLPLYVLKFLSRKFTPSTYSKLEELNTFGNAAANSRRYT